MRINNRISRLEVKSAGAIRALAESERNKKIEVRQQWRRDNHDRIRWQMFLSIWGPDSDWYTYKPDPEDPESVAEVVAQIAYSEKFKEILKNYDDYIVDFSKMKGDQAAFAFIIELFYGSIGYFDLLSAYLAQNGSLLDLPANTPLADLAARIISENGFEWLQICYSDERQQDLEEQAFGSWISENFMLRS